MFKRLIVVSICCAIAFTASTSMATDQERGQQTKQKQEQVFGWELMTPEERIEHRNKMRSFQSEKEREKYRLEHHKEMKERAREKGVTLPDMPTTSQGRGMGPGGKGMGPGGGGRGR